MKVHIIEGRPRFRLVLCSVKPFERRTAELVIEETNTIRAVMHGGRYCFRDNRLVRRLVAMN